MRWTGLSAVGVFLIAVIVCNVTLIGSRAAEDEAAAVKHSIKDVMTNAHKGGLLKKVLDGSATQEDKLVLLDHYLSLKENKPPKGDAESWQNKTDAIVVAAAKVAVGRDDGSELLQKATNCAACHKDHKPN